MTQISSLSSSALLAQTTLSKGTDRASLSMEKLSTGLEVTKLSDDPSAFYAAMTLGARIAWESQATKNISDTSALLNATDSSIEQVKTMLQRIRALAMQAANSTAELDRFSIQAEVDQLTVEIDRLTKGALYNGQKLLQGEQDYRQFYVGADSRDVISHRFPGFDSNEIGAFTYLSRGEAAFGPATGLDTVQRTTTDSEIKLTGIDGDIVVLKWSAEISADKIAAKINEQIAVSGVTAEAETRARLYSQSGIPQVYSLGINGIRTDNFAIGSSDVSAAVEAINKI